MYLLPKAPAIVRVVTLLTWGVLVCVTPASHAQAPLPGLSLSNNNQRPEPGLAVDVSALLTDDQVFQDTIEDDVWSLKAQPGRRLIQLPITVTPLDDDSKLASPSIKLRGGRFIAWRIVLDEASEQQPSARRRGVRSPSPAQDPFSIANLRDVEFQDLDQLDTPTRQPPQARPAEDPIDLAGELPEGAPLIARDITVSPNGVIRWKLDRAIPGGEIKSGETGYLLRLRPDRLKAQEPTRPERQARTTGGNQNAREAAAKRRTEELEYRNKAQAYRALRDEIRNLPDQFQAKLPTRLWAVFEVSDRNEGLSLTGPAPLPWQITFEDLEALKQTASKSRSGQDDRLNAEDFAAITQMSLLLADENPMTQRIVAEALTSAGMFGQAQTGDALFRLIETLLKGSDAQAKRAVTAALAATLPPTPATLSLLKGAFASLDPQSKLLALGGMLNTQDNNPLGQRQMLDTANQMINNPDGPGAVYVLDQLARTLADKPDAVAMVGGGIRLDSLNQEALDQVIVYTADAAGDSPVAAQWMEHALLGSSNPKVVRRTVELLGTSAPGGGTISMLTKALVEMAFGPANEDAASRSKPPLRGIAQIPIATTSHSIYRVLNAGDPELRALGWKALRHFQIYENPARRSLPSQTGEDGDQNQRLTLILNAAFNETVTPPQLVTFLTSQQDPKDATAALVRIVVEGRGPAITQAARALVRTGRSLEEPIRALNPDQRGVFATRLYEAVTGSSPMVAGLLRIPDARSPLVNWFAQHIATSGLPEPKAWAEAANGEDGLITLAASSDPDLADAAVASLVASAGGDEQTARDLARRLSNATDRSKEALRGQWARAKQDIYTARLSHAAGRYRLIVNLRGEAGTALNARPGFEDFNFPVPGIDPDALATAPLIKSFNIALIELEADGQSLALSSGTLTLGVGETQLAITLLDPNELKEFGHEALKDLPLEQIDEPIELLPQKDGAWQGAAAIPGGRFIEVVFERE